MVSHPTELTCNEVVELVTEFLDGALPAEDRARLEQHLLVCPPCTLHLGQVRATIEHVGELREPASPVAPATLELFRAWKRR